MKLPVTTVCFIVLGTHINVTTNRFKCLYFSLKLYLRSSR